MVYNQLKDRTCRVYPDNVQYRWKISDQEEKTVIPDASINCQIKSRKGNSFLNAPQFVLEVLSPSTAKYDRTENKELYRRDGNAEYFLVDTITQENKENLRLIHFPHIAIDFEQLFDGVE